MVDPVSIVAIVGAAAFATISSTIARFLTRRRGSKYTIKTEDGRSIEISSKLSADEITNVVNQLDRNKV
jgi:hypothetical protein